jgi:di/tricarboxylate transporter
MSSTAVTAIFIPVVLRIAQSTRTSPSRLMMPLSFAALISGMTTLVATAPNLVVNSELVRSGAKGFSFFSFTPFGLIVLALGVVYMIFARKLLPEGEKPTGGGGRPSLGDWVEQYQLAQREYRVRIGAASPLVGKTLGELQFRDSLGASIVALERQTRLTREVLRVSAQTMLLAGDVMLVDLSEPQEDIDALRQRLDLDFLPISGAYFNDRFQEIGMAEVMVPADSELIGKSVAEASVRTQMGLTVIGLRRGTTAVESGLRAEKLKLGDTLLVVGPWKDIEKVRTNGRNLLILRLPIELDDVLPVARKAPQAVFCLALVVALMISGRVPNVQAALLGCLLMGALGCVNLTSAYRSIDWKTIILIVGMLPFSTALQATGGVDLAADGLMAVTSGMGTYGVLGSLFAITALLGMFISNTATAVLMAPVALAVAHELKASPYPFAMIVALAASTAFMTPVSSPVNTLVVTPGNYTFGDFVKIGVPFSLVVLIVSVLLVPLLLPL